MARLDSIQSLQNKGSLAEWRLDLFSRIDIAWMQTLLQDSSGPVLLTVRKSSQGGKFQGTERQRKGLIRRLLALEPPFFDLECDTSPRFIREMMREHPKTQFILSYHDFSKNPIDLERIYFSMQKYPAFSYKIAKTVNSTNEALALLLFAKEHPKASVICMGKRGEFARVLGPVVGNLIGYASADSKRPTAPGQLNAATLNTIYRYPALNQQTAIYGLIGDPIEKSRGHLYHNRAFQTLGLNAVYIKMKVKPKELPQFIQQAVAIGIQGLSVTIPLKEEILPFLDEIEPKAQQIGAVNTLLFKEGKIRGTNTDGLGALDAIEKRALVKGKKIVLLGAGGAARAIAFEAKTRGADVLILNRTVERAKRLAADLGCQGGRLDEVPDDYDILINASPCSMPIDPKKIRPFTLAMDVVYSPRETDFLKQAAFTQCQLIYGEEMFLNQAARQTAFWLKQ